MIQFSAWNQTSNRKPIDANVSIEPVIDPSQALIVMYLLKGSVDLWKVGKLNHDKELESKIDWQKFVNDTMQLLDEENVIIKKDLQKYLSKNDCANLSTKSILYTVGHSNHSLDKFLELLRKHGVTVIADIRSVPKSRFCPHFNRERLQKSLEENGLRYVFLGDELGGLRSKDECLPDGSIDYERVVSLKNFQNGCERLRKGVVDKEFRIAILCAEKEPMACHRYHLVSRYFQNEFEICHILADSAVVSQDELEKKCPFSLVLP